MANGKIERISDLRCPPTVGRRYLVPTLHHAEWNDIERAWPMLGRPHPITLESDKVLHHWHVDLRFLDEEQEALVRQRQQGSLVPFAVQRLLTEACRFSPKLEPHVCRHSQPWDIKTDPEVIGHFGECAEAKLDARGRSICPHEGLDLSQFAASADGTVTCPLHGLRVKVA